MNHKELITEIAAKMKLPRQEVERLLDATVAACTKQLGEGKTIGVQSFGNFEVRKKKNICRFILQLIFVPLFRPN